MAQCPVITMTHTLNLGPCLPYSLGQTVVATSNYSANISSSWIGPVIGPNNTPIVLASIGTATSIARLNYSGTYTVSFKDNVSNCVVTDTITVTPSGGRPTFGISASSLSLCTNSPPIMLGIVGAQGTGSLGIPNGGPVTCTLLSPNYTTPYSVAVTASWFNTVAICGDWTFVAMDVNSGCTSSYDVSIGCSTNVAIPISIAGTNSVCLGSSANFTASGATNYSWPNSVANTATLNVMPAGNTVLSVLGYDINGCHTSGSHILNVNPNCANVWPGDANSDGLVDNTDVFELGLWNNATGTARSPTSNAFTSQYASTWTGTVSTGKNRCHADCNGDGIINANDNTAISANFSSTHAFKNSETTVSNPDVRLYSDQTLYSAGVWNKVDVLIGDSSANSNQLLYGIAFDIDYDASFIETDSVYIVHTPSFLNAANQNINFGKTIFGNSKLYAATVRVDGNNVSGNGKIAEFYFKLKFNAPTNSILNLSVSTIKTINNSAISNTLSGGNFSLGIDENALGINRNELFKNNVGFYPNPSSNYITFTNATSKKITYTVYDIIGRKILTGEFTDSKNIDISAYASGTYMIKFESDKNSFYKKLVKD